MPEGRALIITAKYPDPGAVKTRLARSLGFSLAGELYRAFLHDLDIKLSPCFPAIYWAYTPADAPFPDLLGPGRNYVIQQGDNLGERMLDLIHSLLSRGYEKVVLIGSDLPHLSPELIEEAFHKLDVGDVVLGPAADGGYYLVGMRRAHDLFASIEWSTPLVLAQTLAKAAEKGLRVELLQETFDVDEPEDLDSLLDLLRDNVQKASMPNTAWTLAKLGRAGAHGRSEVGRYFKLTPEQVAIEESECLKIVNPEDACQGRVGQHMSLVAKVARSLVTRFREDLGIPLSDISIVAAQYHDACRGDDRSRRLRPYGPRFKGVFFPHDGHETHLAFALRKTGAKTIASIVRKHGVLRLLQPEERTIDENVLVIADAMVEAEQIVPVSVRKAATIARYASDDAKKRQAYEMAYDVLERTLELYFEAGLDRHRSYSDLSLPIS